MKKFHSRHQLEHKDLLNHLILNYQVDFPLISKPFHKIAEDLNVTPEAVLEGYKYLQNKKIMSRLGPIFRTHTIGHSFLAAIACPVDRIDDVAHIVNSFTEVNHNYLRENSLNIWFVCTGESKDHLSKMILEMESLIGLPVFQFPMKKAYKIDLKAKEPIDWSLIND